MAKDSKRSQVTVSMCMGPEELKVLEAYRRELISTEGYLSRSAAARRLIRLGAEAFKQQRESLEQ